MKNILITGATGFVGSHFVSKALEKGFEVHVTVRPNSDLSYLKEFNVKYHSLSLFDKPAFKKLLHENQVDYILHNAGITKTKKIEDYFSVNAHATKIIAEAAVESERPIQKFVYISSLAALGPGKFAGDILSNERQEQPCSYYGKSKLLAEKHLEELPDLNFIVFRPTGVYGPREKDFLQMIKMLKAGIELYIGNAPQTLSFIYVKDLSELVMSALEAEVSRCKYVVSDGNIYDKTAFGKEIAQLLSVKPIRLNLPVIAGSLIAGVSEFIHIFKSKPALLNKDKLHEILAPSWACDTSELTRDFKFAAQYNLRRGLEETINWYQREGWLS
ncbi:MAG: NAD(P)-dependent oxidoreductase [Saprospiraceae bacterium]|nr:NAD(P)-dependent oxidoreductase [Saprospiraceae bacterium]